MTDSYPVYQVQVYPGSRIKDGPHCKIQGPIWVTDMPAMATPFVVPKVPLAKSGINSEIESGIAEPARNAHVCGTAGTYSCGKWCTTCPNNRQSPCKKYYGTDPLSSGDPVYRFDPSRVEYEPLRLSPYKTDRNGRIENGKNAKFSRIVNSPKSGDFKRPNTKHRPEITGLSEANPHEQYLKEVEALRGKLRELKGAVAVHRQLPETPRDLNVESKQVPRAVVKALQEILETSKVQPASESKRIRHISDSDNCVNPNIVYTSPKRPRDDSPKVKGKSSAQQSLKESIILNQARREAWTETRVKSHSNQGELDVQVAKRSEAGKLEPTVALRRELQGTAARPVSTASGARSLVQDSALIEPSVAALGFTGLSQAASQIYHETIEEPRKGFTSTLFSDYSSTSDEDDEEPSRRHSKFIQANGNAQLSSFQYSFLFHPRINQMDFKYLSIVRTDDKNIHPSLRLSLFENTPPFIRFASDTAKAEKPFPALIQRALKWKLTTITPIIVKKIVQNSGYKFIRRTPDWVGIWGKHMKSVVFRTLKDNQKLNHFPGTFQIGRKDRLWRNIQRFMTKHGKKEFGFMPRTYILPQDIKALRASWDKEDTMRWIVKPPASARGSGIKVVNKWVDVPKKVPLIVQKYISNPYLINGNKFDLRLYVLVTSFDPLRIYIYENGLVRFASARYSDDLKTLSDRYIHLTNYSINKYSNNYASNEDAGACAGHKWTLRSLWSFFNGSVNIDTLWSSLVDLVIKTMISGESPISQLSKLNLTSRYCSYELFGVDVLLDENLKPWLLEVNISPSLHSGSSLDTAVKGPLVTNILNLVGFHIPDTLTKAQEEEAALKLGVKGPLVLDHKLYVMGLSLKEKEKHAHFSTYEDRELYLDSILEDLTPDDVRHLIQYEDELTQAGNFQRIFPTSFTFPYHKFLEGQCYYNRLMDAWENRFGKRREAGIELLRSFCSREIHLEVSEIEPRSSSTYLSETSSFQIVAVTASDSVDSSKKSDELKTGPGVTGSPALAVTSRAPKLSVSKLRSARSLPHKVRRLHCKPSRKPAK